MKQKRFVQAEASAQQRKGFSDRLQRARLRTTLPQSREGTRAVAAQDDRILAEGHNFADRVQDSDSRQCLAMHLGCRVVLPAVQAAARRCM
jgi:hypothetical protein